MFSKILQKTKGKTCSWPSGKICASCKSKKVNHPHVVVKEPRRLTAPVSSKYYKPPKPIYQNSPTIQYLDQKKNKIRKREKNDSSLPKCFNFCRWYKRRKALKELIKEKKEEETRKRKKKREKFEKERMKDFIAWERAKQRTPPPKVSPPKTPPPKIPPPKTPPTRTKTVHVKNRSASARPQPKPKAESKHVAVKKLDPKNSMSNRFVNYCYRLCCQLYCYLTCIVLVVLTVIYFV